MASTQRNFDMSRKQAEELADSLARALNAVEIPCVLWGSYLLSLWGVPTYTPTLDFVIPDATLATATEVMTTSQLTHPLDVCPDAAACHRDYAASHRPLPAFHLHIQGAWDHLSTTTVRLFLQSETLWFLPPFGVSLASPRAHLLPEYLVLACDTTILPRDRVGYGNGAFISDQTVVLVPKSEIMVEAYMRIMGRDWSTPLFSYENLNYMAQYVEERYFMDAELLPEPFKDIYVDFRESTMPMMVDIMERLRQAVGLPPVVCPAL